MLAEHRSGERPLYREREWRQEERRKEKEKKKVSWFKNKGGQKCDFPLFCPMSPGGRLANIWKKIVEEVRVSSGGLVRAKVVEQAGVRISALLVDSSPGEVDQCGKPDCNPCKSGTTKRLSCHRSTRGGLVYKTVCDTCGERGLISCYHGRSGRCLYTRQREHQIGFEKRKEDNALWKHKELHHPDEECAFAFQVEKFFQDPSSQGIFEGVSINHSPSAQGYLMNSKSEYEQGQVARVVIESGLRNRGPAD